MHRGPLSLPTYGLGIPEKNPLFFEKRVYQGSCGKVYPVPFIDKVFDEPQSQIYDSVKLENDQVRLVMLPEIGGRIFLGQDKTNADYDFFYRQDEIKPALVGLAGPWISGGVEFNWPQHHRPGTYMPVDTHLEEGADGSKTVWMSEHDPLNRLKGMHGVRLHPNSSLIELKARLYNRTPFTQTFLWWANVAAEVHDNFQSFFPPDVHYVADHAVRAQSSFPRAQNLYYGVEYAGRPEANDLSWYKNIPVPTSYMVCDTRFDFFGAYDYDAEGGFIHVANHHISPGKKQWTWGNHEFGWAWDRELTDRVGRTGKPAPYVELMAGVYTDNQPDFTYLQPYETKTFSQYWWPFKKLGPVQNANKDAALRLVFADDRTIDMGAAASRLLEGAHIVLRDGSDVLLDIRIDISPENPWVDKTLKFTGENPASLELCIEGIIAYRPVDVSGLQRNRDLATEPPLPEEIESVDELYLTAEHLEQYRHPTRCPEIYWEEILRRDPKEARTHLAMGRAKLKQGLFADALTHFKASADRLTHRHPNPCTGEAHYYMGLAHRFLGDFEAAYGASYKATWDYAWKGAASYELAAIDARRGLWEQALEHCEYALDTNRQSNKTHVLKAMILRKMGREWRPVLEALLELHPLDHWARFELGDVDGFLEKSRNDAQTVLDLVYDYADTGFADKAIALLHLHHGSEAAADAVPNPLSSSQLTHYALAWLTQDPRDLEKARSLGHAYMFPSRQHDQIVLEWATQQPGNDGNAFYGLGNLFYDRKRHEDAIHAWEQVEPFASVKRNLGIAYWNVRSDGPAAKAAYESAIALDPEDARIFTEYDQLREKLGDSAEARLATLLDNMDLVLSRDDCSVSLAALYNETGQPGKALELLLSKRFHPWEGGEGKVLKQYTQAHLALGQRALEVSDGERALEHFEVAMQPPQNLGEAYHLLQAKADVYYWKGRAYQAMGLAKEAKLSFVLSAEEEGDFEAMAVTEFSELSYFKGLSLIELGQLEKAEALFVGMKRYAECKLMEPSRIDYFATSLPLLLVFEEDLEESKNKQMKQLIKLADKGIERLSNETNLC